MSLRLAVVLGLALGLVAGAAEAAESPALARLTARAEACIRAAVPKVERAEPSLSDGVDFILHDLCAIELGNRQRFIQSTLLIETMKGGGPYATMMASLSEEADATPEEKAQAAKVTAAIVNPYVKAEINPDTGEIVFPEGVGPGYFAAAMSNSTMFGGVSAPEPSLRALTGRLLLDARLARNP